MFKFFRFIKHCLLHILVHFFLYLKIGHKLFFKKGNEKFAVIGDKIMKIKLKRRGLIGVLFFFLTVRCDPKYGQNEEIAVRERFDSFVSKEHKPIPQSQFKTFGIALGLV